MSMTAVYQNCVSRFTCLKICELEKNGLIIIIRLAVLLQTVHCG